MRARPKRCHRPRRHRKSNKANGRILKRDGFTRIADAVHFKLIASFFIVLLLFGVVYCNSKYIDLLQNQLELKLRREYEFRETEMRYNITKACQTKCIAEIYELKQNTSLEEMKMLHHEKVHNITSAYRHKTEMDKYQIKIDAERTMARFQLEMEAEVEKVVLESEKSLKELALQYAHQEQMEQIRLLSERELEFKIQMQDLQNQKYLEGERIKAARDLYMRLVEPVKIRKKKSAMFGLYSSEYEEVRFPAMDAATVRAFQQAMQPSSVGSK